MAITEFETYYSTPDDDHHYDEAASVQRMRDGDTEGFTDIYNEYSDLIRDYLNSKAGHRVPQDTLEDILQDTFLKAFTKIDTYTDVDKSLRPWLITIAFNGLMDHYRRQARHDKIEGIELVDDYEDESHPTDIFGSTFAAKAIMSYLISERIISAEQLDALWSQKVMDVTGEDFAKAREIAIGQARKLTFRARQGVMARFDKPADLLDAVFPDK